MNTIALIALVFAAGDIFGSLFFIGTTIRYSQRYYLVACFEASLIIVLAGRVLGWW